LTPTVIPVQRHSRASFRLPQTGSIIQFGQLVIKQPDR
jgi:hypothetical protein